MKFGQYLTQNKITTRKFAIKVGADLIRPGDEMAYW